MTGANRSRDPSLGQVLRKPHRSILTRFNRWTQHLNDGGVFDGTTTGMGSGVDGAGGDALTGTARRYAGISSELSGGRSPRASRAVRRVGIRGNAGRTRTPMDFCANIFPKGTDLARYDRREVQAVADALNNREDARLEDTDGSACRPTTVKSTTRCCDDRLNPP